MKRKIIAIYFILLPIIDLITALFTRFTDFAISPGMIIKGLTLLVVLFYSLLNSKSKYKKKTIIYYGITLLFFLIYILAKKDIWSISFFKIEIIHAFKYFYFPLMIVGMINIFDDLQIDNKLIQKILLINCITYGILLLVPYITGTYFNSYYDFTNFKGSNGWFYAANETGIILTILISSIYFLLDNNKKWKIIIALPIMYALSLVGTKVSFIGLISVTFFAIILFIIKNKKNRFLLPTILFLFLLLCCYVSPTTGNFIQILNIHNTTSESITGNTNINKDKKTGKNTEKEAGEQESQIQIFKYTSINDITNNKKIQKVVKILLSGREGFFLKNYSIYSESGAKNIALGLGWNDRPELNYTFERKLIEIDLLDIIIHYGIVGFIIYFIPLIYILGFAIKNIKYWKAEVIYYLLILFVTLGVSIMAGHTLSAPPVSIYIVLIIIIINNYITENRNSIMKGNRL